MPAAATHTDLTRIKPVRFLKNPTESLEKEKKLLVEIWDASGMNDEEFSKTVIPAVQNLAEYVELLPASAQHHHSEEGGLFRHSLETALFALRLSRTMILARCGTHAEVNFSKNYWSHAAFLCGLFHDLGKVVSSFAVFDQKTQLRWYPTEESLWAWGIKNKVESVLVIALQSIKEDELNDPLENGAAREAFRAKHRGGDPHEEFTAALADKLIPSAYRKWLLTVDSPNLLEEIQRTLTKGSPESSLKKCIKEADGASTKRNVFQNITFPVCESTASVAAAFLNGISYALARGFWTVNKPGAQVFVIEGKCFIDWNRVALSSLCAFLETHGKKVGFIQRKDELAQWLLDNGLVYGNPKYTPKGDRFESPFFTVMAKCEVMPTRALWLTTSPFIGLVPSIPGFVYDCTGAASFDADDVLFTSASRGSDAETRAGEMLLKAEEIQLEKGNKLHDEAWERNSFEGFTEEKSARTKAIKRQKEFCSGREGWMPQSGDLFKAAGVWIDRILKKFGYARFYDAQAAEVQTREEIAKPHGKESPAAEEEVIIQGFQPPASQKALSFNQAHLKDTALSVNTEPLFHEEAAGWKTYRKFPIIPLFDETEFFDEEDLPADGAEASLRFVGESSDGGIGSSDWSWEGGNNNVVACSTRNGNKSSASAQRKIHSNNSFSKSPSFSDFADKTTSRFLWRYYPFAQKLSVCASPHTLKKLKFKPDEESDKAWLWSFASEENIPSEIFPGKVYKSFEEKNSVGNTSSVERNEFREEESKEDSEEDKLSYDSMASGAPESRKNSPEGEIRFAPLETDGTAVIRFAKFYEKVLRAYRIGTDRGCFPKENKNSEFYPLFIELAALFINQAECVPPEGAASLPLVEMNAASLRVNAWVLFCGRFRAVCRNPDSEKEGPTNLLTRRVEKFLKPFIQVHRDSFLSRHPKGAGNKEEDFFSSDFAVVFTDRLTVNAVNFLVRGADAPSSETDMYFRRLYEAAHENAPDEMFRADEKFGFTNGEKSGQAAKTINPIETDVVNPTNFDESKKKIAAIKTIKTVNGGGDVGQPNGNTLSDKGNKGNKGKGGGDVGVVESDEESLAADGESSSDSRRKKTPDKTPGKKLNKSSFESLKGEDNAALRVDPETGEVFSPSDGCMNQGTSPGTAPCKTPCTTSGSIGGSGEGSNPGSINSSTLSSNPVEESVEVNLRAAP